MSPRALLALALPLLLLVPLLVGAGPAAAAVPPPGLGPVTMFGTFETDFVSGIARLGGTTYVSGTRGTGINSGAFVRTVGAGTNDVARAFDVSSKEDHAQDVVAYGGFLYVLGTTAGAMFSSNVGNFDIWVTKLDADLETVWSHQFGSTEYDAAYDLEVGPSGLWLVGSTYGDIDGNQQGMGDMLIQGYDLNGTPTWHDQVGGVSTDAAIGLALDATGVTMVGYTSGTLPGQTSLGGQDGVAIRYSLPGARQWTDQLGTPADDYFGTAAFAPGAGTVVIGGSTAGSFGGNQNQGARDALAVTVDAETGQVFRSTQPGTTGDDYLDAVTVSSGHVYLAGRTAGVLAGTASAGASDVWVAKQEDGGRPEWLRQLGTANDDVVDGLLRTSAGLQLAGTTYGAFPDSTNLGSSDGFVALLRGWRPDLSVSRAGRLPVGADRYEPVRQRLDTQLRRKHSKTFSVRVGEDGESAERLSVRGCTPPKGLTYTWRANGRKVTGAVTSGRYRTPTLLTGQSVALTLVVHAGRKAPTKQRTCVVRVGSTARPSSTDRIVVGIKVKR